MPLIIRGSILYLVVPGAYSSRYVTTENSYRNIFTSILLWRERLVFILV